MLKMGMSSVAEANKHAKMTLSKWLFASSCAAFLILGYIAGSSAAPSNEQSPVDWTSFETPAATTEAALHYDAHWRVRMMKIASDTWDVGRGAVLLLGDSNTEMLRPSQIGECEIINAGFGGARIADIADRTEALATLTAPAIVHIMIGSNDGRELAALKGSKNFTPPVASVAQDLKYSLRRIIDPFKARGAEVVLWRLPPTGPKQGDRASFQYIDNLLKEAAAKNQVRFEDQWAAGIARADGFAKDGWVIGDGIHLSPNGQKSRIKALKAINDQFFDTSGKRCIGSLPRRFDQWW